MAEKVRACRSHDEIEDADACRNRNPCYEDQGEEEEEGAPSAYYGIHTGHNPGRYRGHAVHG